MNYIKFCWWFVFLNFKPDQSTGTEVLKKSFIYISSFTPRQVKGKTVDRKRAKRAISFFFLSKIECNFHPLPLKKPNTTVPVRCVDLKWALSWMYCETRNLFLHFVCLALSQTGILHRKVWLLVESQLPQGLPVKPNNEDLVRARRPHHKHHDIKRCCDLHQSFAHTTRPHVFNYANESSPWRTQPALSHCCSNHLNHYVQGDV